MEIEMHSPQLLICNPSSFEVEFAVAKLEKYKSPSSDQIQSELIQVGGGTYGLKSIHLLIVFENEELPDQWKETIIVPVYKKGGRTDYSNYRGISLLSTSYRISSIILLSMLSPYIDEIIGDHQCGF
jgi:hypothetical protein